MLVELLLLGIAPAAIGADEAITLLQTSKATYTNVIVTDKGVTNIYIRHDGGVVNIKIGDLRRTCSNVWATLRPRKASPPRARASCIASASSPHSK